MTSEQTTQNIQTPGLQLTGAGFLLAVYLLVPATLVMSGTLGYQTLSAQLSNYDSVIYFKHTASDNAVRNLASKLEKRSNIRRVKRRSSQEAFEEFRQQIGPKESDRLGLDASMIPQMLVIEPKFPQANYHSVAKHLTTLKSRKSVVAIDTPSSSNIEFVHFISWIFFALIGLGLLMLVGACLFVRFFFVHRLAHRAQRLSLMEGFGVTTGALKKRTLKSGSTVGIVAGTCVSVLLALGLMAVYLGGYLSAEQLAYEGSVWSAALSPVPAGLVVGLTGAMLANWRFFDGSGPDSRGTESLQEVSR